MSLEKMVQNFLSRALDDPIPLYSNSAWARIMEEALLETE